MVRVVSAVVLVVLGAGCRGGEPAQEGPAATESGTSATSGTNAISSTSGESETGAQTETETGLGTGTETETETETGAIEVSVQWIEVAASDYKLELDPEFDASILDYVALADGPDIRVDVDVIVDADVDGVLINQIPAQLRQ